VTCEEVIQQISDYLDGEVPSDLRRAIEDHLCACHDCDVVFDTTRKTIELYCDGRLFPLPEAVQERLHAVLRRECQGTAR
jgi:anti-sigma factor RsiW